ncbi:MAG: transcriptional regulator [Halobacteriales archaeon]|nr:transcriptional regulator [Halobacteriales archaeon]
MTERTLIIRHETVDEFVEGFGEQVKTDDDSPDVVAFADPDELGRLMTRRRIDLIETVMTNPPDSIRDLAEKVDRGLREVHEDVHLLADRGIVELVEDGRAKKPRIPYDNVRIEVDLPRSRDTVTV